MALVTLPAGGAAYASQSFHGLRGGRWGTLQHCSMSGTAALLAELRSQQLQSTRRRVLLQLLLESHSAAGGDGDGEGGAENRGKVKVPRNGDLESDVKSLRWRFDPTKSVWWSLLQHADVGTPGT